MQEVVEGCKEKGCFFFFLSLSYPIRGSEESLWSGLKSPLRLSSHFTFCEVNFNGFNLKILVSYFYVDVKYFELPLSMKGAK